MELPVSKKASLTSNLLITKDFPDELLKLIVQFCEMNPRVSKIFSQHNLVKESIKSFWLKEKPWLKKFNRQKFQQEFIEQLVPGSFFSKGISCLEIYKIICSIDGSFLQTILKHVTPSHNGYYELIKLGVTSIIFSSKCGLSYVGFDYQNDYDIVMMSVKNYGPSIAYASERLQMNEDIIIEAVKNIPCAIEKTPDKLRFTKTVNIIPLEEDIRHKRKLNELKIPRDMLVNLKNKSLSDLLSRNYHFQSYGFRKVSKINHHNHLALITKLVQLNGTVLHFVDEDYKENIDLITPALRTDKRVLKYLPEKIKYFRSINIVPVKGDKIEGQTYDEITLSRQVLKDLKTQTNNQPLILGRTYYFRGRGHCKITKFNENNNLTIISKLAQIDGQILHLVDQYYQENLDLILLALKTDKSVLKYCNRYLHIPEIVTAAIQENYLPKLIRKCSFPVLNSHLYFTRVFGRNLQFITCQVLKNYPQYLMNFPEIADNVDSIIYIMNYCNLEILNYIPKHLIHNMKMIIRVIEMTRENQDNIKFCKYFLDVKEIFDLAIHLQVFHFLISSISDKSFDSIFKDKRIIEYMLLTTDGHYFHKFNILDFEEYFISELIKKNIKILRVLKDYSNNPNFVLYIVDHNGLALQYASPRVRGIKWVAFAAIRQNPRSIQFMFQDNVKVHDDVIYEALTIDSQIEDLIPDEWVKYYLKKR